MTIFFISRSRTKRIISNNFYNTTLFNFNNFIIFNKTSSNFRPFSIKQNCNRNIKFIRNTFYTIHGLFVPFISSVRKVEPSNIHPFTNHFANHIIIITSRPNGTHNFCFSSNHIYIIAIILNL